MRFKSQLISAIAPALLAVACGSALAEGAKVDPTIAEYTKSSGVSGNLSSVGSDTLANLMTLWAEEFKREYPNVNIQIQAAGSSTAPPALTEGTSNIGPMSRRMKDKEIEAFEKKYGYKPTEIRVAIDALAVFVHKDNPIEGLTIPQVDAIFSSTRKCGEAEDITRWGQVGLTGGWEGRMAHCGYCLPLQRLCPARPVPLRPQPLHLAEEFAVLRVRAQDLVDRHVRLPVRTRLPHRRRLLADRLD